ncbi:molybdopterin synthase catalytic subunit-like isoform X2 [Athalia rosae]|uniref:molybdopterin synthase catalytic subunit-like isoform X2 n=1 Tax=Athalia rosae TaxID=37344 RepID=UPI00203391B9|nr:molybdopterin synthase catalytic subunit-like isoform X2 [Athalia rosae]
MLERTGKQVKMDGTKDVVRLQTERLSIEQIVNLVTAPNCGAISTFIGITRDNFEEKKVIKLEYEAYEPMALKELQNVCSKVRSQWDVERIAIFHRLGVVPVTEASVVIAISSPHRQESLQATQLAIDMLKSSVPIWKKEIYDTNESEWKQNKECSWSTREESHATSESIETPLSAVTDQETGDNQENEQKESSDVEIDPNLVQIQASAEELNRRIEAFITRKREQMNIVNVQEFCCHRARVDEEQEESSCARVDAILIRRKDSKSHVKVHRVLNPWGPNTVDTSMLPNISKTHSDESSPGNYPPVLDERFMTSENQIGIKGPVPKDVYQRLKRIEDRILYLESLSPEYRHFWEDPEKSSQNTYRPVRKRTFSTAELDSKLHELENKYAKRV